MGEASLAAGDVDGGVDESAPEPEGAASSESPEELGAALNPLLLCPGTQQGGWAAPWAGEGVVGGAAVPVVGVTQSSGSGNITQGMTERVAQSGRPSP